MALDVLVIMDPIGRIKPAKDTSFALLLEAQRRGHRIFVAETCDLSLAQGHAFVRAAEVSVRDDPKDWYTAQAPRNRPLASFSVALMRTDPPVDAAYLHATHLLSHAQREGLFVVNDPQGLRDLNEKLGALLFPECCPPTLVSCHASELKTFLSEHEDCVLKPLDGMGGRSIFRLSRGEPNVNVVLETLTDGGKQMALAQRYLPEIVEGDKRILLIDGEPVPYCLARIPQGDEFRGNLAAGGRGEGRPLSERDRWIAAQVGPELARRGMLFVGLDVIGDYLTEVNVTSPTCARELDAQFGLNIAGLLFDRIEMRVRGATTQ